MEILGVKYYALPDAAKMLGVKLLTLYRWRNDGKLACSKMGGRYYVEESTIKALMKR